MLLKKLEIYGFKSFADKFTFDFKEGITCIVGPNGSGKSNVSDAVRWVLGEQSAKNLRGGKMEDVIFAGTEIRKPMGFASVSIYFDNADRSLNMPYDEVVVSRRVYRSGESEYKINGAACRLRDIEELFYDTGVGQEGYSIIGQGRIDRILSGKKDDKRELFEEAASIVTFKKRKEKAIKELKAEEENLTRIRDINVELEARLEPLREASENARKYLSLYEELKEFDCSLYVLKSDEYRKDLSKYNGLLADVQSQFDEANEKLEKAKAEYSAIEETVVTIESEEEKYRIHSNEINEFISGIQTKLTVFREKISSNERRKNELETSKADLCSDIEHKKAEIAEIDGDIEKLNEKISEIAHMESDLTEKKDAIQKKSERISVNRHSVSEDMISCVRAQARTRSEIENLEYNIRILNERLSSANDSQKDLNDDYETLAESVSNAEKENAALKDNLTKLENEKASIQNDMQKLKSLENNSSAELNNIQRMLIKSESELSALHGIAERYDGYVRSVKRVMELAKNNKDILGVIADVISTDKQYEVAVETAFGSRLQNIITTDEKTAKGAIDILIKEKAGRATFIPLSSVKSMDKKINERYLSEPGVIGTCNSVIKTDERFEKIVKSMVSNVLIVDTADNAVALQKKSGSTLRIVTLRGELLNPSGSITGGSFKNNDNLLSRSNKIADLTKEVNTLKLSYGESAKKLEDIRTQINALEIKENDINIDISECRTSIEISGNNINNMNISLTELQSRINSENVSDIEDLLIKHKNDLVRKQDELDSLEKSEESIKADNNTILAESERLNAEIDEINTALSAVNIEKSEVNGKVEYFNSIKLRIQNEIRNLENSIDNVKQQIEAITSEMDEYNNNIHTETENLNAKKEEAFALNSNISEYVNKRKSCSYKLKELATVRESLSEQISLLDKELSRLSSKIEKIEYESDRITEYMWSEYELTYSYAKEKSNPKYDNINDITANIKALKDKIKSLGNVNVNAIDEYNQVKERYEFLSTQYNDLVEATNSLKKVITELDREMRKQFETNFELIKASFKKTFRSLFGGGTASIELENADDVLESDIIITAKPPGKKLTNMIQLSGGERALTAIALLFAIQSLKPSSFCLLDEIEAALDDANVTRFANYLHKLSDNTQFIVITHRRGTMNEADRLYGITMQEKGVSKLVSVELETE